MSYHYGYGAQRQVKVKQDRWIKLHRRNPFAPSHILPWVPLTMLQGLATGALYQGSTLVCHSLHLLQGRPILICTQNDEETQKFAYKHLGMPMTVDCLQGIVTVIPMQLLSFHIAVLKGYDVSIYQHPNKVPVERATLVLFELPLSRICH